MLSVITKRCVEFIYLTILLSRDFFLYTWVVQIEVPFKRPSPQIWASIYWIELGQLILIKWYNRWCHCFIPEHGPIFKDKFSFQIWLDYTVLFQSCSFIKRYSQPILNIIPYQKFYEVDSIFLSEICSGRKYFREKETY